MTDYEKLTVVKLREELVKRGLPKSGLKAALIQRLVEADAQLDQAVAPEPTVQHDTSPSIAPGQLDGAAEAALPNSNPQEQEEQPAQDATSSISAPQEQQAQVASSEQIRAVAPVSQDAASSEPVELHEAAPQESEVADKARDDQEALILPTDADSDWKSEGLRPSRISAQESSADAVGEEMPVVPEQTSIAKQDTQIIPTFSGQESSVGENEARKDTNKRKRRSQSPPPSSVETAQKRAKADNGRPHVTLPEDETNGGIPEQTSLNVEMTEAATHSEPEQPAQNTQTNGLPPKPDTSVQDPSVTELRRETSVPPESDNSAVEKSTQADEEATPPPATATQSPLKPSPTDTRFKNLFTAPTKREGSPNRQMPQLDHEDRVVSPALHPATSALYIRDFMRPLNPGNLKDYLVALASPTDADPDPEIVVEFFLDSIRTHCLVNFANTSAASRVRLGLHDRVWPDEKNRKPLWVDFVPEEKLKKWIEVESEAAGDRRQGMKKWEVVYEEENDGIMAYLQEAGPNSAAPRSAQPAAPRTEGGSGIQGAPSGPRGKDDSLRPSLSGSTAKADGGKAFGALDDLFSSTTAKPKLYYLPVASEIAEKRLDRLAEGRGGGRGDEMRRYSFEDGTLVDKGAEFGMRGRGGFGARGGGYRGYTGRGGSYRGDAWRGR